jgi:hypothetical protein
MMLKSKQKFRNLFLIALAILAFLALSVYILLNNSYVQNIIRQQIVSELCETLHTRVDIAQLSFQPFSHFVLKDVYLEDQHQDTLFYVHQVNVRIDFWKLFTRKVSITEADIRRFDFHLRIDSTGQSNLAFVLKAFASKDTTHQPMRITFHIKQLTLNEGRFQFTNEMKVPVGKQFDAANLDVRNLHMNISLQKFSADTLAATIHSLSLTEQSGVRIDNLQTVMLGNSHGLFFPKFLLKMPHSDLRLDSVFFHYDTLSNLTNFAQKVKIGCHLLPSDVAFSDFAGFVPSFKGYDATYRVSTYLTGTVSDIKCNDLKVSNKNNFKFDGNFEVSGLPTLDNAFVYADVTQLHVNMAHLQDMIAHLTNKPFLLPAPVLRLGTIYFRGSLTGFLSEMVAYGNVSTRLGDLHTDLKLSMTNQLRDFSYSGSLSMNNFQLGTFLNNPQLGNVTLHASVQGVNQSQKPMSLTANATIASIMYNQYVYQGITFNGTIKNRQFDGSVSIHDPNVNFDVTGLIDWNKTDPMYQFTASLQNFRPNALHLTQKYPKLTLSLQLQANLQGDLLNQANGTIAVNQFQINNDTAHFLLPSLKIDATQLSKSTNEVRISSPLIEGSIQGHYNLLKLSDDLNYFAAAYLPSLFQEQKKLTFFNDLTWKITLDSIQTEKLGEVLDLPVQLHRGATFEGMLNSKEQNVNVSLDMPDVTMGKNHFTKMHFSFDNPHDQLRISFNTMLQQKESILNFYANFAAAHDSINTKLSWDNNAATTFAGELTTQTHFTRTNNQVMARMAILPTQFIVNDSTWNMRPGMIRTDMHTIWVDRFDIDRNLQHLIAKGTISDQPSDSLQIDLLGIRLEDVSDLIHLTSPRLNGSVSGLISILSVLKQPIIKANIVARNFGLNNTDWGDAYAVSRWDGINHKLDGVGKVYNAAKKDTVGFLAGSYFPANDSLAFFGGAHQLPIDFLNTYLESFLGSPKGFASGTFALLGPSKHLWFQGDLLVQKGQANLNYLNTTYFFDDSVHLKRGEIDIHNMTIRDKEGHTGKLSLVATNHDLKDWHYDVQINANDMLALNTTENNNASFWGRAYASGLVHVYGDEKTTHVDINATSQPNTTAVISVDNSVSTTNNSFITYVVKKNSRDKQEATPADSAHTSSSDQETIINATLNITPDAHIQLLIDKRAGDRIDAVGSGVMNILYNLHTTDLQMLGNYTVNSGNYLFTFQNALSREFKLDNGSTIRWDGSAKNPQIDINATYEVTASLADLMDADLLKTTNRTSVPVDCLLNLTGNLMHPDIKFNIDLPNARDELKRSVKNIINTDEMMNRQIIYLLAFGRFYTPDYMRSTTNNLGQNELLSVATSTLSSQLNSWLSQAVKGLNLGLNWRRSGMGDMLGNDYEAAILYQNNRWVINGNVGYRDDNFSATKFIGDLDVQYRFSQNGRWSIRAYNHTNDYKELNPSLYSQGIGLTYTQNFNSISELFENYWETFKLLFRKKLNAK